MNNMNNMYTIIFTSSQHILKYFLYRRIHKIQNVRNQMKINNKIQILIKLDRNFKIPTKIKKEDVELNIHHE